MTDDREFLAHLDDVFAAFGPIRPRRMFGGYGVYHGELMIALIADDTLYLKVDDRNRADFEAAGMRPFTYEAKGKRATMSYYEVPPDLLEDPDAFAPWARKALDAAVADKKKRPPRKRAKR